MSCFQLSPRGNALATLQRHLPTGPAWYAFCMPGKNAYKLWQAFARSFDDADEKLCELTTELDPRQATDLLPEWEKGLSLPDPCLPETNSDAQRRERLMFRLDKRRWTTVSDWQDLAGLFGLTITVTPGWHVQRPALWDTCFESIFWDFPKLGRFRVYVDVVGCDTTGFDYDFEYPFPDDDPNCEAFRCLIERVAPANVVIIWNQDPVGNGWLSCGVS